jgi:hypothetical protein
MATVSYDNLRVEKYPSLTRSMVLLSGEDISKGQAVSTVDASGKVKEYDSTESGETFYGIALEDAKAEGGDGRITVYEMGVFSEGQIIFSNPSVDDVDSLRSVARSKGIHFAKTLEG